MNTRIQALAEQATSIVEMVGPQGYASSYANFDREKFAQLIVRECVSIAQSADDDSWKLDGKGTEIARNIQQHFGVES